jgi:Holliday junction resolvase-like predicted endonuclease
MTDQELKDLVGSLAIAQAKTNVQFEKTEKQIRMNDEKLARMGILLGSITNNQGDVAEEFFYNSLEDKMDLGGIHYDFIDKNASRSKGKLRDEFDIVMINGKDIAIIEVKYKAHKEDLEKLLTKKYENFKELYPMYKDYTHHLALASFYMPQELKEMALENNVIVLQRKGDVMESFIPKAS